MLKVGILSDGKGWHFQQLVAAFAQKNVFLEHYYIKDLAMGLTSEKLMTGLGKSWEECDVLLVRGLPGGSLEQIIMRMDALHSLEKQGMVVINSPGCLEKTVDKFYTTFLLARAGLKIPPTIVTENYEEAMEAFYNLGEDVLVKPLFGSGGKGIVRLENPDLAHRVFRAWQSCNYVYYIQKFIPCGNKDVRVFVLGDGVLAAMLRENTFWKANYACGAKISPWSLSREAEEIALKAAKATEADYAGVDLLYTEEGEILVSEVNGIPGWEGLQQVCSYNVASEIANYVLANNM
jgi:RimK family alpha-L-glutamate ligase